MAPPIVWMCLFVYLIIGSFVYGILHNDPGIDARVVIVWPFILIALVFFSMFGIPYWLGCKVSDIIIKIKNRGDNT